MYFFVYPLFRLKYIRIERYLSHKYDM